MADRGVPITSARVIAEQTFGFWTALFAPYHIGILANSPINAFTNLPTGYGDTEVYTELTKLRKFRNRINHYEPIVLYRNTIDFSYVLDIHESTINVLNWLDPKLIKWMKELDKVPQTLARCRKI